MTYQFFNMTWKGFCVAAAAGVAVIAVAALVSLQAGLLPLQLGLAFALAAARMAEALYSHSVSLSRAAGESAAMFVIGLLLAAADSYLILL